MGGTGTGTGTETGTGSGTTVDSVGFEAAETGGMSGSRVLFALLLLIPVAAALDHAHVRGSIVFLAAMGGVIPLAAFLGRATEEIAIRSTPALGALMNASLGNAIELMIAAQILLGSDPEGPRIVRASIVGSVMINLLWLIGASMIAGGLKYREQRFNATAAGVSASLLIIAFSGVSIPSIYGHFAPEAGGHVHDVSRIVSVILAVVYVCGILFAFLTHRHLFDTTDELRETRKCEWTMARAIGVLVASIAAVAYLAHLLARTLDDAGDELGLSKTFVGVVLIGAITNVAENLAAISYARKNNIDLPIHIGTSSAIQVVLFVTPILVLIGAVGGRPLSLQFTLFELAAMLLPVLIMNNLAHDGECNWLEGVQLMALYGIIGTAFFFIP